MNFNYEIRSFWKANGILVHNILNNNLIKLCESDVKGGKYFFPSNLGWSIVSPNLKFQSDNNQKVG